MIERLFKIKKYIPFGCYMTIFDIPFGKLYEEGKRKILIDVDNTMLPYDLKYPTDEIQKLFNDLKEMGYEIILLSNNNYERVSLVGDELGVSYFAKAYKPLKCGFKKALRKLNCDKKEIITIGDQLMTDILGSNRVGLDGILVKAIKRKTEKWYTKLNRKREENVLRRIGKYNLKKYDEIMSVRGEDIEN